jgi:methanogenesis multiheme c-type cytochrome
MSKAYNDSGWGNGLGMLEKWCALPNFNLEEQGQTAWEGKCGSCHIGASWRSDSVSTPDCTKCHEGSIDTELTAPTVAKCMDCHSKDTAKRGDVFDAGNDAHIAAGMNCQDCHPRLSDNKSDHQIAKGTVIDTSEDTMEGSMDTCADCHGLMPHRHNVSHGGMLDKHCDEVACEVCHTGLRPGSALANRTWAEFTAAGKPVTGMRGTDWLPDHKWYSSEDVEGHLPILGYTEHKNDSGAKIYAFNPVTVTWFINTSTSDLDDSIVVAYVKAADASGDNVTNVTEMRAYDGNDTDLDPDYPDATLVTEDMNFQISHSVTAKEDAFNCDDCHGDGGWVLDWAQLGYDADPRHKGKHR